MSNNLKIEVYSKDWCPYCKKAKAFLKSKGLKFEEIDIEEENNYEVMQERTGNKTVPQIIINDQSLGGYDDLIALENEGQFNKLIGKEVKDLSTKEWELVILGAGPAALNAALYGARKGIDLLLLTKDIGGQVINTNEIDNYLGKADTTGADLIYDFWDHIAKYKVETVIGEEAVGIEDRENKKVIKTDNGKQYLTASVIIATGAQKRHLGMKQEYVLTGKGVHYCASCDAFLYKGQPVAVVGGGNSGLEAALDLANIDCKVNLIEFQDRLMGDKYLQDRVNNNENITVYTSTTVDEINGKDKLESVIIKNIKDDSTQKLNVNGLFIEIGLIANSDFVSDLVETNKQKEIIINEKNETGVERIWAAGDVTDIIDKQIIISAAEGAKAALRVNQYLG
ncbi:MAG: alkyl hydroperoxide reductase subunit F [Halanaerobium sp. 4-GBenrich]|jgi:alkyl hydroperoxide reductase subunit F|uniref:Alkyl hydroperoxide reductase subunit F n=1 Tax=Halanaerobium congolense TaxID=54121 RepID=A0A1G9PUF6_9FIRM|nr:glutaredoxin 3 [Halanaerobium congolense]ODS50357.1 MAG: alkyl hydroperoxide reductase subunit F [Halanaerobium sp. 4-GBenrich]PUU91936.1 MAG: alkyl hydroperoxide reductase subunit F [Halanaerobium sp.]TDX46878.1 alkyl hydroperoxide reductase subunit F [Halanaerobium congolense]SDI48785.1 alkyl hydroperoxide reductase subunit F [Halanaerobium congolense]SDK38091.1 alkyl hydroperoxide reductase subunit F [Halanaerobium congolense]